MGSISSLLTLAGLDDPSKAPSFQSVVLDQIKHLRKQLDEDEQALLAAEVGGTGHQGRSGGGGGGRRSGRQEGQSPTLYSPEEGGLPLVIQAQGEQEDEGEVMPPMLVVQSA